VHAAEEAGLNGPDAEEIALVLLADRQVLLVGGGYARRLAALFDLLLLDVLL
jgi:hypothetical protein